MNNQRFIISTVAVFAFLVAYSMAVHGHLMMPFYLEFQQLWRPQESMDQMHVWGLAADLALAAAIAWLYTRHYEGKGLQEGVRFGLYVGVIMGLMQFMTYIYMPISLNLALAWFAVYVVQGLGAGIILSLVYKA